MGSEKSSERVCSYPRRRGNMVTRIKSSGESSKKKPVSQTSSQEAIILGSWKRTREIGKSHDGEKRPADRRIELEKRSARLSSCGICMEKKTGAEMFKSRKCSHSYCRVCVGKYVAAKIGENILKVKCPHSACNGALEPRDCRAVVPQPVVDRWEAALCEHALGSKKIYCPFKDCSAPMVDDGLQVVTSAECPHCHRLFCAQCKVPWHAGFQCKSNAENMDRKFVKLADKEKWQKCPHCKFYVQRTHGCESITCRCGNRFCYVCGKGWSYGHLCQTGGMRV